MENKKISFLDILQSRYGSDENLPEWVERRRSICDSCPLNSKNKPKSQWTLKERAWVAANHGKDTCLDCKCMLEAKTKLPHAKCPVDKWGVVQSFADTADIEFVNISTTPLEISFKGTETILDYGNIKIGQPTDVQLLIIDKENKMTDISAGASCGCTIPKLEKKGKEITLKINYDTNREGSFNKTVVLSYKKNNIKFEKIFKITGKTE